MDADIEAMKVEFLDLVHRMHRAGPPWVGECDGLTPNQARALHLLWLLESGAEPARPSGMACHLAVSPSALSQVLKALEERGLITRDREEGDYRAVTLRLTPAGEAAGRSLDAQFTERLRRLVDYVGADDFSHMLATMGRLVEFRRAEAAGAAGWGGAPGMGACVAPCAEPDAATPAGGEAACI